MYHLKLIKALSYSGVIEATKQHPDVYVDNKAIVDRAVATGYFKLVEETEESSNDEEGVLQTGYLDEAELADMKFDDLKRLAADMGIGTKGLKSKADYAKAIAAVEVMPDPEIDGEENEIDYGEGSPTMTELQEQ